MQSCAGSFTAPCGLAGGEVVGADDGVSAVRPMPFSTSPSPGSTPESSREISHRENAGRSPYLAAVRDAWARLRAELDPRGDALALALAIFARDGRARGVPVAALLRALDSLIRPTAEMEGVGFARVREWAGTQVNRADYRAD